MFKKAFLFSSIALGFMVSPLFITNASAKFKPFKCAKAVGKCVKAVKALPSVIKTARAACNEFKHCKKKCRLDKSECSKSLNRESKDLNKVLGKGTSDWMNRLCKRDKYTCKEQCKADYLTPACVNARSALGDWLLSSGPKAGGLGDCVKALDTCIPTPVTACTSGIYTLAAQNKDPIKIAAQRVKKDCKDLRHCTKTCLVMPTRKGMRKCRKDCRKKLKSKACKSARSKVVTTLTKNATDKRKRSAWFSAVKACGGF